VFGSVAHSPAVWQAQPPVNDTVLDSLARAMDHMACAELLVESAVVETMRSREMFHHTVAPVAVHSFPPSTAAAGDGNQLQPITGPSLGDAIGDALCYMNL